ncbi:MAG TPA: CHAT domain-containing protein, partial [Candidatus Sulfotelmatobacter sp.]
MRRKALTQEAASTTTTLAQRGNDPELLRLFEQLRRQRDAIADATMDGLRRAETAFMMNRRVGLLTERREELEREIASKLPKLDFANSVAAVTVREIARALPDGAVLVEFVQFAAFSFGQENSPAPSLRGTSDRIVAFILDKSAPDRVSLIDLGDALSTEGLIEKWRSLLTSAHKESADSLGLGSSSGEGTMQHVCDQLRKRLVYPLRDSVGDRLRLIIAPDGALSLLPFEVLPFGDDSRLIDHFDISYVSTGRDVL